MTGCKITYGLFLSLWIIVGNNPAYGNERSNGKLDSPFQGLIINSTITSQGYEFYQKFVESWEQRLIFTHVTIEVGERVSRLMGREIWLKVGQTVHWVNGLPVKREKINALSELASEAMHDALMMQQLAIPSGFEPDIKFDEI